MVLILESLGIACEYHHHEVATAGQCEIDMRFTTLMRMADQLMTYKYVVRNCANRAGKAATFMPKPIFGDNGSGMHCHQSLWKDGQTLMADDSGYAGLSEMARGYVGGLLTHAPALLAFAAPTTNSYRRLVPGFEAPVNLVYSQRNRSACIRIPVYSPSPKAKRIEFRCPDPTANPYLAFSAMLLAGIDGIQKGLDPGAPADFDLFEEGNEGIPQVPGSLAESLDALEADHEFLLAGGVFTREPDPDVDRLEAGERGRLRSPPAASGRVPALLRRVRAWGNRVYEPFLLVLVGGWGGGSRRSGCSAATPASRHRRLRPYARGCWRSLWRAPVRSGRKAWSLARLSPRKPPGRTRRLRRQMRKRRLKGETSPRLEG